MTKRRVGKYVGIIAALTVICTLSFWAISTTNVLGKFVPEEPYVTGEPEVLSGITVTSEGSNLKGEMGTGAEPSSKEVPTAEGKKGSKTNPFVILEIVPDHAQQQIPYLAAEDYSDEPLDIMKWGIEMAKEQGKSFAPCSAMMDQNALKKMGQWFCNWQYEVFKIGTEDEEKETCSYANIGKIYTLEITEDDLKENGIDPEQFKKDYESSIVRMFDNRDRLDANALINKNKKYEDLFAKDKDGKKIRDIAINNKDNWQPSYENKLVKEAVTEWNHKGKGYILAVEPGKGDFALTAWDDWGSKWVFTKTGSEADRWVYVENEDDIPAEYRERHASNDMKLDAGSFHNYSENIWWESSEKLLSDYRTDSRITGIYMDLSENASASCRYDSEPEVRKETYTFEYYGIYNKNIMKRQLFIFADQKDYDNFHMKVVTMTPSELNAMSKEDTAETLDMIERADMFYIGCYGTKTGNISNVYDLYYKFMQGKDSYDVSKINTFVDNDLEWELCYKILYRLCNNKNLPMIMTQGFGEIIEEGTAKFPMYQTATYRNVERMGTLNNLAKLYLIAIQFDLTAKKAEDDTFVRTFYDDFLMTGAINKIGLSEKSISEEKDSEGNKLDPATETGYYRRPKLAEGAELSEAEKCYYLWNTLTFFPEDMEYVFYNDQQASIDKEIVDAFVARGYMRSFFESHGSTVNKIFTEGGQTIRQDGSNGSVGNVGIPHNNGDNLYSTLLGNTESAHVYNTVMDVAYQIMNNRPFTLSKQIVKVQKQKSQYVKMGDTSVLLDFVQGQKYDGYREYDSSNPTFLKIQIHNNGNSQPGVVTKLTLKNEDGDKAPKDADLKLYATKDHWAMAERDKYLCEKETYEDSNGTTTGYKVDGTLTAYVPYSLQQWSKGYNIIEVKTVARSYNVKKKKYVKGNEETDNITIDERTLFNLE